MQNSLIKVTEPNIQNSYIMFIYNSLSVIVVMKSMLRIDLNFTFRVVGQRQKIEFILHKFFYLYPFMQDIILLPTLPYLYIDRN